MKNFMLTPNTQNAVKSALMSLVILFSVFNFSCLTHSATAMIPGISDETSKEKDNQMEEDFPFWTADLQDDSQDCNNEDENCIKAVTEKTFRKDLNLLDLLDSLYGRYYCRYPNLTKVISKNRSDNYDDQERYKSALDYYTTKKFHKINYYEKQQNDFPVNFDQEKDQALKFLYNEERSYDSYALEDEGSNFENTNLPKDQVYVSNSSDSDCGSFHPDGFPRLLNFMPNIAPPRICVSGMDSSD